MSSQDRQFFQVEAVNLDSFVYDTHDNRTIRGGSFLLLDAIRQLAAYAEDAHQLELIQSGASQALLRGSGSPDAVVEDLKRRLAQQARDTPALEQASFCVAHTPETGNLTVDLDMLQNRIRVAQLRQPSVWFDTRETSQLPCAENGLLPGSIARMLRGEVLHLSRSVRDRQEAGRRLREAIVRDYAGLPDLVLTDDLEQLATGGRDALTGKMALLYADGNAFGKVRRAASSVAERKAFSQLLDRAARQVIRDLAQTARRDSDWQTAEGQVRLEVLMVGGDELLLAVPAWQGWRALRLLFGSIAGLEHNGHPLTWSAGLVFCHHKAPLLGVRALARDLAERAKVDCERKANACHALVMESFDGLPRGVGSYFGDYLNGEGMSTSIESRHLLVCDKDLDAIERIHTLTSAMARSQVFGLARQIQTGDGPAMAGAGAAFTRASLVRDLEQGQVRKDGHEPGGEVLNQAYQRLLDSVELAEARRETRTWLMDLQTQPPADQLGLWMRQVELMDYIRPVGVGGRA